MTEVLRLEKIGRTYPGEVPVPALKNVNLSINEGDFVSIVGPSGSGKSTLLNVLGLLDTPTSGNYQLSGYETTKLSPNEKAALRANSIGFVFQAFHLLNHRSVLENVALSGTYLKTKPKERLRRAQEALETVGLTQRQTFLPNKLSGGERQRVAIARAICGKPDILLCDEPTGNLDSVRASSIMDLFHEMHHSGYTIIIVTHDPKVAAQAQRTFTVKDGNVSEEK